MDETKTIDKLFLNLCEKLKTFDQKLNENFNKLKTNFDRFKFIWYIGFVHSEIETLFEKNIGYDQKNASKALEHRQLGNELYKNKQFYDALVQYNLSLKYAPLLSSPKVSSDAQPQNPLESDENQLALTLANRSAVFFHLDEYFLCVNDIDKAFKSGYPANLKHKLIERKFNCLLRLEAYQDLIEFLKNEGSFDPAAIETVKSKLANDSVKQQEFSLKSFKKVQQKLFKNYGSVSFELGERNSRMPNASNSITLDHNYFKGFHLKATKDIQTGDILVDEPPFASVLLSANYETNCFECMVPLNPLRMNISFCRQCAKVSYCSVECEKSGWRHHHQYECKYLNFLANSSGITHMEWLSLRIVLRAGYDYLISLKGSLKSYELKYENVDRDESALTCMETDNEYKSDSYLAIFNLITNSSLRKLNDLFRRAFVSFFLVKFLLKVNFMPSLPASKDQKGINEFIDNTCFIGGLILRHSQSISCNAHEVSLLKLGDESRKAMAKSFADGIGAGIYAILSLFNHSCDPHVTRYFRGSRCQVRAIRRIKKDEEVYDNYGAIYAVNDFGQRQEKLIEQYYFQCTCTACEQNWPLYAKIPSELNLSNFKCYSCLKDPNAKKSGECSKCQIELDEVKLEQHAAQQSLKQLLLFNSSTDLANEQVVAKLEKIYETFCEYIGTLESRKIKRPFQDFNNYEEALKQCLNLIHMK